MSEGALPKQRQSAYQRWELAALGEFKPGAQATRKPGGYRGPLPTVAEIDQMHRSAHDEGYAAGLAAGSEAARAVAANLENLLAGATREMRGWETRIAEDLVALAVEIAHQVVREALGVRRDLIVAVVREAIGQLPLFNAPARLAVNPADAELVRESLGEQLTQLGWKVLEDETLERGGCRIEGGAGHVDATIAIRWERVVASLGSARPWLERGAARRVAEPARGVA